MRIDVEAIHKMIAADVDRLSPVFYMSPAEYETAFKVLGASGWQNYFKPIPSRWRTADKVKIEPYALGLEMGGCIFPDYVA